MRTVAVFTGSRSEYGLLYPVLRAIDAHADLDYRLIVGAAHLEGDFGATLTEIEKDGFRVHGRVAMPLGADTLRATAGAIGNGILGISAVLADLRPDCLVLYGDRYESFAALIAATQMNIPVAHIEGGDYTEGGALDDSVRHAMTKLAHFHFTTNAAASERVLKLGEEPWRVRNVGLPALDMIAAGNYASEAELGQLGIDLARPVILFCQHSVTTEADAAVAQLRPALAALRALASEGCQIIVTYPNSDAGGRRMIEFIEGQPAQKNIKIVQSLGRHRFHGVLHHIGRVGRGAMVGNSSAGIKETPIFGCPTVNIGTRQRGRLRSGNVLDVGYDAAQVEAAVRRCIDDEAFRAACAGCENPYGDGLAGPRIAATLAALAADVSLLQKKMTY